VQIVVTVQAPSDKQREDILRLLMALRDAPPDPPPAAVAMRA
jgi:hypothetical protein